MPRATLILAIGGTALAIFASLLWDVGIELTEASRHRKSGKPSSTPVTDAFDPQRDYDRTRASDEIRAYHGNIFFARVDTLLDMDGHPVSADVHPDPNLRYLFTVDRSLVGSARGQMPIIDSDAYVESFDYGGFGPLRIGERYLFFAGCGRGGPPYCVSAGTGTILIFTHRQEEKLAAKFIPLIAAAEVHEQQVIASATAWAEARGARADLAPTAAISPDHGPPGIRVTVSGVYFGFMEVTIGFGRDRTFADVAVADGSFKTSFNIPHHAPPGPFTITIDDEQGFTTKVTFTVTD